MLPENVAIFPTLSYNPQQSRPARHAVAVLMLLKIKRKPQKASLRRTGRVATVESGQAAKLEHFGSQEPWPRLWPAPRRALLKLSGLRPGGEGQDVKRVSANVRCGP